MPEYDSLDPDLNAIDQVRYAGELLGMNPAAAMQRAHEVLEYVGLRDQRYRKIESFSTGMKQATKLIKFDYLSWESDNLPDVDSLSPSF